MGWGNTNELNSVKNQDIFRGNRKNVVVYLGHQARSSLWEEERALLLWKGEKIWLQTWVKGEGQRNKRIKSRPSERYALQLWNHDNCPHPCYIIRSLNPPQAPWRGLHRNCQALPHKGGGESDTEINICKQQSPNQSFCLPVCLGWCKGWGGSRQSALGTDNQSWRNPRGKELQGWPLRIQAEAGNFYFACRSC